MTKRIMALTNVARFTMAVIFLVTACLLAGCATTPTVPPDFAAAGFDPAKVDTLHVLAVLDHRVDQTKELPLDAWVLPWVEKQLKYRGYNYVVDKDPALVKAITRDSLETLTPEWIAGLGPSGTTYVMILVLEDSRSKLTFGSTGNAEMSGFIFDKAAKQVVWQKKQVTQAGLGGLLGMAAKGLMERGAVEAATYGVMTALPSRKP